MRQEIDKVRTSLHQFGVALADLAQQLEEIEALPGKLTHLDAEYEGRKARLAQIDELIAQKEAQLSELAIKTNDALAIVRGAFGKKVA
jgi:DNA repair exonuclease SbcCD ATPase subunit